MDSVGIKKSTDKCNFRNHVKQNKGTKCHADLKLYLQEYVFK